MTDKYATLLEKYRRFTEESSKVHEVIRTGLSEVKENVVALKVDLHTYKDKAAVLEAENATLRAENERLKRDSANLIDKTVPCDIDGREWKVGDACEYKWSDGTWSNGSIIMLGPFKTVIVGTENASASFAWKVLNNFVRRP